MGRKSYRRLRARRTTLAVTVAIAGALAQTSGPPTHAAEAGATVQTEAASPPIDLPAAAEVGQRATLGTSITHLLDVGTIGLRLELSSSVTAVNADGSYSTRSTIDTVDITASPEDVDIDGLQAVSFNQSFSPTGEPTGASLVNPAALSQAQKTGGRVLLDAVGMINVGFPAEPVSVGSSWTTSGVVGSHGLSLNVTYQCRLAEVVDGRYRVELTYSQDFNEPGLGGVVAGTVSGSGTISGALDNPLVVSGTVSQVIVGIVNLDNGSSRPVSGDTTIEVTSAGG